MKKQITFLIAIFIAVISLKLFIFYGQKKSTAITPNFINRQVINPNKPSVVEQRTVANTLPESIALNLEKCIRTGQYQTDIPSSAPAKLNHYLHKHLVNLSGPKVLWENRHLALPDGTVIILRLFIEDGENGTFNKLMIYREAEDNQLPQIVQIPPEEQVNPAREIIEKWEQSGKTIYREVATNYQNSAGADVFLQEVNGEVKKMTIHTSHHYIDCP